jgi:hypothetical protein
METLSLLFSSASLVAETIKSKENGDAFPISPVLSSTGNDTIADAGMVSMLQSFCEESGAEYALFWSIRNGRLFVTASCAKYGCGKAFVADSCTLMMKPGEGIVGQTFNQQNQEFIEDARYLSATSFLRLGSAKSCNIRSLLFLPLSDYGVLEFGSHRSWRIPSQLVQAFTGNSLPSARVPRGLPQAVAWEAVLWKRSRFVRCWRRRVLRLMDVGDGWQLSSLDVPNARITGVWSFNKSLSYIHIAPEQGFLAMMRLSGLVLAADSQVGADAMEELATIFNGSFMRYGHCRSSSASNSDASTSVQSRSRNSSADSVDLVKFESPRCDKCGEQEAKGRLVIKPVHGNEIGQWLCKHCFIATWLPTCEGEADGRLQERPQWLAFTSSGALVDCTPPRTQRYSHVS